MTKKESVETTVLNYLAMGGEYYGNIDDIPDDILVGNARAQEKILSSPNKFPLANIELIESAYCSFAAACASRLISI